MLRRILLAIAAIRSPTIVSSLAAIMPVSDSKYPDGCHCPIKPEHLQIYQIFKHVLNDLEILGILSQMITLYFDYYR